MKEQRLKWLLYGAGVLSLLLMAVGYSPSLLDRLTVSDQDAGEFYRLTKLSFFKEPIPPIPHADYDPPDRIATSAPVEGTRLLTMGDSFFWLAMGYRDFTTALADRMDEPISYAGHWRYHNPFLYVSQHEPRLAERRILVLGVVERDLHNAFRTPWPVRHYVAPDLLHAAKYALDPYLAHVFSGLERRLRYFLEYNYLTFFVEARYRDYRFHRHGEVSEWTPLYLRAPRQQFYAETAGADTPAGYFYPHSDSLIARLADTIEQMRADLRTYANTELILVPVPNKITVYDEYLDVPYDRYLPRLLAALDTRGVPAVDLYTPFQAATERLYYISDPHWNAAGRAIAFDRVAAAIRAVRARPPGS
jgi:hypothetical protein